MHTPTRATPPQPQQPSDDATDTAAMVAVGRWLQRQGYHFTTVTPATHARVNARYEASRARSLRDVFGWSRPFAADLLEADVLWRLRQADLLDSARDGLSRSKLRFSSLGEQLFAHSAYPTEAPDAVFFGPDTVRFAALVAQELARQPLPAEARILDVGCGAGPGGILAACQAAAGHPALVLADINPKALRHAQANAELAGLQRVQFVQGDLFTPVEGRFDLVVANPPYLNDGSRRVYRHGGGDWGGGLSERIVREGLPRLTPGGRLVLYTGAAVVQGADTLRAALRPHLEAAGWPWEYREIDPDVFGEELEQPAYAGAERIAAVSLVVQRPGPG